MGKDKRAELGAVTAVMTVILTGAFILQNFGIPPLLDVAFEIVTGGPPPVYFGLATGAIGTFAVLYQIAFVLLISPIDCYTPNTDFNFRDQIDFSTVEISDFVNLFLVFILYEYLAFQNGITDPDSMIIGFVIIVVSSIGFRVVPRSISKYVHYDCWWTIKLLLVSTPIALLLYMPVMLLVAAT
jgi:hypothetical protein